MMRKNIRLTRDAWFLAATSLRYESPSGSQEVLTLVEADEDSIILGARSVSERRKHPICYKNIAFLLKILRSKFFQKFFLSATFRLYAACAQAAAALTNARARAHVLFIRQTCARERARATMKCESLDFGGGGRHGVQALDWHAAGRQQQKSGGARERAFPIIRAAHRLQPSPPPSARLCARSFAFDGIERFECARSAAPLFASAYKAKRARARRANKHVFGCENTFVRALCSGDLRCCSRARCFIKVC